MCSDFDETSNFWLVVSHRLQSMKACIAKKPDWRTGAAGDIRRPGSAGMMPVNSSGMGGMPGIGNNHESQLMGNGPMGAGGMSMSNGPLGNNQLGNGGMQPNSMGGMHMNNHASMGNGLMPGNSLGGGIGGGMPMGGGMRTTSMGMGSLPNGYMGGSGGGSLMGNGGVGMHQMNMGGGGDANSMLPSSSMPQGNNMQPGSLLQGVQSPRLLASAPASISCPPTKSKLPSTSTSMAEWVK